MLPRTFWLFFAPLVVATTTTTTTTTVKPTYGAAIPLGERHSRDNECEPALPDSATRCHTPVHLSPRGGCLTKCLPIPHGASSSDGSHSSRHSHSGSHSGSPSGSHSGSFASASSHSHDYGPFTTGHRHAGFHSPSSRGSSASPPLPSNHSPTQIGRMIAGKYLKPWNDGGTTHWHGHDSRSSSSRSSSSGNGSPKKKAGPRRRFNYDEDD